ncbi:MAG: hypothetical protein HKN62_05695 [Phycisphaerales bacterium]|nr:hypothetical protein [Phycisphaerales bacterium]
MFDRTRSLREALMMRRVLRFLIVAALAVGVGCRPAGEPDAAPANPAAPAFSFAPDAPPYDGPPIRFEVTTEGPATQFRWSVTAPTGGWEVTFEGGRTYPPIAHGAVKVLIVRPGADEMVTQTQEQHDGQYRHGNLTAKTAELLVRVVTRGMTGDDDDYRVAASWSAPE